VEFAEGFAHIRLGRAPAPPTATESVG
jgi:hypothetical protein